MGKRVPHPVGGATLTQQHMEGVTDVNKIMDRFNRTGVLGSGGRANGRRPEFLEVSGASYHEMLVRLQKIQGTFASLPAKTRKRFSHNPENLLRFLEDDKNLAEAIELGLVDESDVPREKLQQMDIVDEATRADWKKFEEWRRNEKERRSKEDEPPPDNPGSDEESQPTFSKKGRRRTS